jgi:hypothetical protein
MSYKLSPFPSLPQPTAQRYRRSIGIPLLRLSKEWATGDVHAHQQNDSDETGHVDCLLDRGESHLEINNQKYKSTKKISRQYLQIMAEVTED